MKPSIPKGTRDFSALELAKRQFIMSKIRRCFELFGFQPIETPSFENASTLMGKYGEEGDRLIFKILNSGDYLRKADEKALSARDSAKLTASISEKALRYDLTVPFARYVVQHQGDLQLPFKRYQIQPVWRADRPQKGRFREFYQCDADVVGSKSLWQEVEFTQLYDQAFLALGIPSISIKLNHRKVLSGIAEKIGAKDKLIDFTVALDKLDKIGKDGVIKEMVQKGIPEASVTQLEPLMDLRGTNEEKLAALESFFSDSAEGKEGVEALRFVMHQNQTLGLSQAELELDLTLARGLNYYTGCIFEVKVEGSAYGSVGGGGRYDDLTGIFGLNGLSGVGISFGLDRIYLVMEELGLFDGIDLQDKPKALFVNFGEKEAAYGMKAIAALRKAGISAELYPDSAKMKKQMSYAHRRAIEFVVLVGDRELESETYAVKDMKTGEQQTCNLEEMLRLMK